MPKRDRDRLDPEEVLRGRVRPGPTALCALVRAVNPSDLALPAPERARLLTARRIADRARPAAAAP